MVMGFDTLATYYGLPALFALLYAAGFILALVYWRRCPSACRLVAAACAIHFVVTCTRVIFIMFWFQFANDREVFNYVILGLGFMNLIANAILLLAAFAGRNEPTRPYPPLTPRSRYADDDDWESRPRKPQPPAGSDDVGIRV